MYSVHTPIPFHAQLLVRLGASQEWSGPFWQLSEVECALRITGVWEKCVEPG
jgi:hypothetical protein